VISQYKFVLIFKLLTKVCLTMYQQIL